MQAQHVANFFLEMAEKEGLPLTQMKLQKLVYIGYGWVAAVLEERLFDEEIQAWAHGPVVPSLYHEFKHCKNGPISERSVCVDLDTYKTTTPIIPDSQVQIRVVLTYVWQIYKRFSAVDLRNKTHEPGSPWSQVYKDGQLEIEIPFEVIKNYFKPKIAEYLEQSKRSEAVPTA